MIDIRHINYADIISEKFGYDSNIRHLLYVIIPAFIEKYGTSREKLILNTFNSVQIYTTNEKKGTVQAYYTSIPKNYLGRIVTEKIIVINNYDNSTLLELLDNLVHEFNHAVNSYNNEIKIADDKIYLRTGLTFSIYDKHSLEAIKKADNYVLEEIINTRQTEEIIDIIKHFHDNSSTISSIIEAINNEFNDSYNSKSYFLEKLICKKILTNKTFLSTLSNLRITGDIYEINSWFDNITNEKGSYEKLGKYLNQILELEKELDKKKFFRFLTVNKIKNLSDEVMLIVDKFNCNCHFR